jgi:ribosomal-protein-alanine N-acetyltransferase
VTRSPGGWLPEVDVLKFGRAPAIAIETERMILRLPVMADHGAWSRLRREGGDFLREWEPSWSSDHFSRSAFRNRVFWANRSHDEDRALPLFLIRREDDALMGAITLDHIRRGPAFMASVGYWIGPDFARQGYMSEALETLVRHAFDALDLSRIEAACLPGNVASRKLLERAGFKYEGVAQSYLQIDGRWRNHVLYAILRNDRRGRADLPEA